MRRFLPLLILLALLPLVAVAADLKFPPLTGRVVDQVQLLSPQAVQQLDQQLAGFEQKTGDQVVVAIVSSLQGVPVEQYGYQLGRAWGIGQKGKDNGVIFLVAPTERKIRIEVGYGLEGVLTDAQSKLIIADVVAPKFKAGQMQQGVVDGVQAILQTIDPAAAGQGAPTAVRQPQDEQAPAHVNFLILLLPIIVVILLASLAGGRFPGGSFLGGMLLGSLFGGRGGWGGGGSGDDDNFSGGGGSFGGGGASGDY
jgi:uncharacterized protein